MPIDPTLLPRLIEAIQSAYETAGEVQAELTPRRPTVPVSPEMEELKERLREQERRRKLKRPPATWTSITMLLSDEAIIGKSWTLRHRRRK